MNTQKDLIILTYQDYVQLRSDLKVAGLDLCYMAQAGQPVRLDWSADLFSDATFLQQVAHRRPADSSYCLASVRLSRKGGWFRPDEFIITFHSVGTPQEAELRQYLVDNHIHSSAEAPQAKLVNS